MCDPHLLRSMIKGLLFKVIKNRKYLFKIVHSNELTFVLYNIARLSFIHYNDLCAT